MFLFLSFVLFFIEEFVLDLKLVLFFPIAGSFFLVCMFYFFEYISFVVLALMILTSVTSLSFFIQPILAHTLNSASPSSLVAQIFATNVQTPVFGKVKRLTLFVVLASFSIVLTWLFIGGWTLNNLIAVSMAILVISLLKFPNLKVAAILLIGLFFFDIFWVFVSPFIFGDNVMSEFLKNFDFLLFFWILISLKRVSVASKKGENPISILSNALHLPNYATKQLELPIKLLSLYSMLGLGDIILPGLLSSFAFKMDRKLMNQNHSHFKIVLFGFSVGLFMAFFASHFYDSAQPALLYLVPSTLIPFTFFVWRNGNLSQVWGSKISDTIYSTDFDINESL